MSQSEAMNQPPGSSTRKTSAISACLSAMWTMLSFEITTSNVAGGNGNGPGATLARPIRAASCSRSTSARETQDGILDINASDVAGGMVSHQRNIDATCTAADIEHREAH